MKDDCIFCKLANGIFDTNIIYEDDTFTVILDASPANPGHALILPKEHYQDVFDIDEEVLGKAMKLAKRVAARQLEVLKCDGVNIIQNNKEAAGQSVLHYHLHVIPRYKDDGQKMLWKPNTVTDEVQKEMKNKLFFK
ncbi:MAG: HIT domain-containing protein [Lachnospiraceae bacterium]|nr:HIT domain-containing protein [Lachnospiraceae bacterium]MBO7601025.1 HIT domain-containing protein [Lachnospiraceae bacterium]